MKDAAELWDRLAHLFASDDGTLPNIYVEPLTRQQMSEVYDLVRSIGGVPIDSTLWSNIQTRDILIQEVDDPVGKLLDAKVESFRHGLPYLRIDGIAIPYLTVEVTRGGISFDYRMGPDWTPECVHALFKLFATIQRMAPQARIFHADEGLIDKPNDEFSKALRTFVNGA